MTRVLRPYIDRGKPGELRYHGQNLLLVSDPPIAERVILQLQTLRRHNTLQPELVPTHRVLLRWAESGGTGLPNPGADRRELHYDPLPSNEEEMVTKMVKESPWDTLTTKWYRTTLDSRLLAEFFCVSRTQLYNDWRCSLWYYRGRFEEAGYCI